MYDPLELQRFHERIEDGVKDDALRNRKTVINDLRETQREAPLAAKWTSRRLGPTMVPTYQARRTGELRPDVAKADHNRRGDDTRQDMAPGDQDQPGIDPRNPKRQR